MKNLFLILLLSALCLAQTKMYIKKNNNQVDSIPISEISKISFNYSGTIPTDSLVAYYPFNGNANDESGNGNHGSVNGATLTTDRFGNVNSAYNFDGSSSIISIANSNSLNAYAGQNITINIWIKTSVQSGGCPISKYNSYSNPGGYSINWGSAYKAGFGGRDKLGYRFSGTTNNTVNDGSWHMLTGIRNGSVWSIWMDGQMHASIDAGNTTSMDNTSLLILGAANDGTYPLSSYYSGTLDDIRIYKRALNATEIQTLYNER